MIFPRVTAAIVVLLLIGSLSLAGICSTARLGASLAHGNTVMHAQGKIVAIGPGRDFVLQTDAGQEIRFQCRERCIASLPHMQRHKAERALTDVYFKPDVNGTLIAINVD